MEGVTDGRITVFLADDNVIVREGVRALLALEPDLEVVGTAEDYDGLVAGGEALAPQVVVTDIRMPPTFQQEGIDAAQVLRKRHPGTGVVVSPLIALMIWMPMWPRPRKNTRSPGASSPR